MQVTIEVQDMVSHDTAVELHEEQEIQVLGEVEELETHREPEDNLNEVMLPLDQALYMVLDPHLYHHQDIHLIQEDHKALEAVVHHHQAPPGGGAPPHPIQEDHKALEVEDHHQAPQYRSWRRSPNTTRWTGK